MSQPNGVSTSISPSSGAVSPTSTTDPQAKAEPGPNPTAASRNQSHGHGKGHGSPFSSSTSTPTADVATPVYDARTTGGASDNHRCVGGGSVTTSRGGDTRVLGTTPSQIQRGANAEAWLWKWRKMLGAGVMDWQRYAARHPGKVRSRVAAGIPDRLRGVAWQLLSGGRELVLQNEGAYQQLLLTEHTDADLEIVRDLSRTYPTHIYFQQRQGPGQRSLYNVLKAVSVYDNRIGYVQGMGFLAGLLLLYMSEEDAFWCLVALLKGARHAPLEGLYEQGLPLLHQFTYQFGRLVEERLPVLAAHLASEGVATNMYCSTWFITVMAYTLPFEHLTRVWDVFLLVGMKPVFQIGLALLSLSEGDLMGEPFEELLASLSGRKLAAASHTPDSLLAAAHKFRIGTRLRELKHEYQASLHPKKPVPAQRVSEEPSDNSATGEDSAQKDVAGCSTSATPLAAAHDA